ncbi:Oidioi.mRNA.OKI2018_I69.chr2.g7215.t2.cds [Oikopleura dioica]|uniref:Oidioi.mRNA.OKI2018_I69.chr2.g7215.t2.cds n=1 Tax=Oikopleura dioica TaxID=34765 RepID=A0ABN7T7T4_OIKDI|nr:Oidioi.mRNA.OKI2018_I69.chr2.g7215.t2.cds [Oikopleura dioica]
MVSNLRVMLDQALGSGDDAGAVNFLELKVILDAILVKLDIGAELPQVGPNGEVRPATDKYHERLQQLEKIVEGMTRPKSPNTLIQQTQNGDEGPITKDFAENRLKKRVDANEEGIEKALDMLEKLARQLKNVESDLKDTKDRMASEQKAQDDHLSALDSLVKELESKMEENKAATDKVHDLTDRLANLEERAAKVEQIAKEAVNWSQLDESFSHDFFGNELDNEMSKCHEEREKYQNYFEGLHKLADMRDMIEDINSGLAELDKHVQSNINDITKRQVSRSTLGDSRLSLAGTPSRDYLLQNSNHSLTGRAQPPSPNMQNISSKGSSRTNLNTQPQVGAPSQALGGSNSKINPSPQVARTDPAASSSNKQDGNNALSNQNSGSNNIQKDTPFTGSSSSSRRVSDHNISGTPSINNETLNALGSNQASPHSTNQNQSLPQSVDPQNQTSSGVPGQQTTPNNQQRPNQVSTNSPTNTQIHSPSESCQIAESPSKTSDTRIGDVNRRAEEIDGRVNDLLDENNRLRRDLEMFKSSTEKELAETRAALSDGSSRGNSEISNETVEKLQKQLSGTERELKAMEELIKSLSADGRAKSEELDRLQRLLQDLQERAALKDFVTTSLDQKADAADLRALLSKDELDSTAQSIINQLQELINRQAAHEQSMGEHLKEVGLEVDHRTKDDDFNRFSEQIEKRLRALRKKIEKAGAGGLNDLATEAGAAGFRKQLFNCISCDKDLYMRITNPLLPSPSAFPARMSLRPHTAYDTKHVRSQARGEPSDLLDPIKREGTSDYSTLLVEKELERRRKMKENKIRQEISGYNFKSGSIPRQVGGNRQVVYDRGARQEELRLAMGTDFESADLEGTDGHLYKGRVRKLPNLVRKTLDEEDLNRSLDNPVPDDVHIPPTAPEKS